MAHKIEIIGSKNYGFVSRLVCPEDCEEEEVHQDNWSDIGLDLILKSEGILATFEVKPEWIGRGEDAELWLRPVVSDGSES